MAPREARLRVQPDEGRLSVTDEGQTWSFAYEVRDDVLFLEVAQEDPDNPRVEAVGPVGRIPAADQRGRSGRWWAKGVPGTVLSARGWPEGWLPPGWCCVPDTAWPGDPDGAWRSSGGVSALDYARHSPMNHYDTPGHLLWFLATDGRLFVHHRPASCHSGAPDPIWADLVRVRP